MKKLLVFLLFVVLLSCSKEGEIQNRGTNVIKINDKEYRFIKVVPADGEEGVWLLVPNDADVELPKVTVYKVSCGKNCYKNQTAIWIKS